MTQTPAPRPFERRVTLTSSATFTVTVLAHADEEADALIAEQARQGEYDAQAQEIAGQTDGYQLTAIDPVSP